VLSFATPDLPSAVVGSDKRMSELGLLTESEGLTKSSLPAPYFPAPLVFQSPPPPARVKVALEGVEAQTPPHKLKLVMIGACPAYRRSGDPSPVPQKKSPSANDTVVVVVAPATW
jgi:hypothetical protein